MLETDRNQLYPLLFEPAYKQVLWGGVKFRTALNRALPEDAPSLGESWDICDRPNVSSEIINGSFAGMTLGELTEMYGSDLVGRSYHSGAFPLMVKIIDTGSGSTSLHVHPTDEFHMEQNEYCDAKTEMWYILQADKGARVFAGLRTDATRQKFLDRIRESDVLEQVQGFDSVVGDAYFIPGGRLHCLGQGNLVLEISRNSDTTFRLSDWNREDAGGLHRELHVRDAVTCLDFSDRAVPRVCGVSNRTSHNRKYSLISHCPFFHCDKLMLVEDWRDATDVRTGFHILTAVNQPFTVENSRFCTRVGVFESVLIPACFGDYMVRVTPGTEGTDIIRTTL